MIDTSLITTIVAGGSAGSLATDFAVHHDFKDATTLGLGATSTTATAYVNDQYVVNPMEKGRYSVPKTANVINYLETYSDEQRLELISEIDEILNNQEDKEESFSLTKKM